MARKKRKLLGGKRRKNSKKSANKKPKRKIKKNASASGGRKTRPLATKARRRKSRPKSIGDRISNAYRTVVDTIKETDRLRNKLEPPATSETE
jgi:hypothetical protein